MPDGAALHTVQKGVCHIQFLPRMQAQGGWKYRYFVVVNWMSETFSGSTVASTLRRSALKASLTSLARDYRSPPTSSYRQCSPTSFSSI